MNDILKQFRRELRNRKGNPERLAALMTDMEHQYSIPLLRISYEPWAARNPNIARLYQQISDARWEANK